MFRDLRKNEAYFENYIAFQYERIEKFAVMKAEMDFDDKRVKQVNQYLFNYRLDLISAMYSNGFSVDGTKEVFLELLENAKNCKGIAYADSLTVLALCILFDINDVDDVVFQEKDDVFEFLLTYLKTGAIIDIQNELYSEFTHNLVVCIEKKSAKLLLEYMKNQWYEDCKMLSWYDAHLSKEDTYCGYWSFVVGAMIRILKLDCQLFEGVDYIPIELV